MTRILGLPEAEVVPLVGAVSRQEISRDQARERFSLAAWSNIAEPGDRTAKALIAAMGAESALSSVVSRQAPETVLERLKSNFNSVEKSLESTGVTQSIVPEFGEEELKLAFDRWLPRVKSSVVLLALKQAARFDVKFVIPSDDEWPIGFSDLGPHEPVGLWLRGSDSVLRAANNSISLVGARAATGYGEHITMEASAGLVDRGYAIVSGAAYGIDGMAHRAALASAGHTIAVLAGGLDRFYPSGHEELLTRIVKTGSVISELPCGAAPTKWRFLQRNRLIAGISQATVVMEAGWRSGSLNTAGHAAAIGRPLGAVPGPVTSAASAGCHRLIREFGATCVTTAAEMAELAPFDGNLPAQIENAAIEDPAITRLKDAMSRKTARPVDLLASSSGLSVGQVQSALGELRLDGVVKERESGWVLTTV